MKTLSKIYIALILFFLYAPVAVMIFFSFAKADVPVIVMSLTSFCSPEVLRMTELRLRMKADVRKRNCFYRREILYVISVAEPVQ